MLQATITDYMPGDILFYKGLPGDIYDVAITAVTHSELVHCAIAISAIQKIEELSGGVMLTPIDGRQVAVAYRFTQSEQVDAQKLHAALTWLIAQKGLPYGWNDALVAAFGFLPDLDPIHYDCSALASEFLQKAGTHKILPSVDSHRVTPALLADFLLGIK